MTVDADEDAREHTSPRMAQAETYTVIVRDASRTPRLGGSHRILVRGVDVLPAAKSGKAPRSRSTAGKVAKAVNAAANAVTDALQGLLILGAGDDLDELADHLTPDEIPTPAVVLQARRNAEWRVQVAETYGLLTAGEIADLVGSTATNRAAVASRLAKEGAIFGVRYKGNRIVYPGFQFTSDGNVVTAIAPTLEILSGAGLDGWELVSWFTAAHPLLGGEAPADHLDDLDTILMVAQDEAAPVGF